MRQLRSLTSIRTRELIPSFESLARVLFGRARSLQRAAIFGEIKPIQCGAHEATFQEYSKQGITWSSLTAAQLEFEHRLTAALMLQQNLVAMEASVAPSSDPSVQARYEQARSEVLSRLKATNHISILTTEI